MVHGSGSFCTRRSEKYHRQDEEKKKRTSLFNVVVNIEDSGMQLRYLIRSQPFSQLFELIGVEFKSFPTDTEAFQAWHWLCLRS